VLNVTFDYNEETNTIIFTGEAMLMNRNCYNIKELQCKSNVYSYKSQKVLVRIFYHPTKCFRDVNRSSDVTDVMGIDGGLVSRQL
jgi:hypothetical protein